MIDPKVYPVWLYRLENGKWKQQDSGAETSPRANRHRIRVTSVAARKDCIVFPALRQKFSLKSQMDQGSVIRRDNKILLVSKRRARAMLLEFQCLRHCLDFADDFVRLNPPPPLSPPLLGQSSTHDTMIRSNPSTHANNASSVVGDEGHRDVVSWITEMLHDKCFLGYIDKIENYLQKTEDGKKILEGLEQGELSPA